MCARARGGSAQQNLARLGFFATEFSTKVKVAQVSTGPFAGLTEDAELLSPGPSRQSRVMVVKGLCVPGAMYWCCRRGGIGGLPGSPKERSRPSEGQMGRKDHCLRGVGLSTALAGGRQRNWGHRGAVADSACSPSASGTGLCPLTRA